MLHNKNKQQQKNLLEENLMARLNFKKKKKKFNKERELQFYSLACQTKKKKKRSIIFLHNFSTLIIHPLEIACNLMNTPRGFI